ncbi:MAG: hypothetical protein EA388_02835 [Nitriliruptor sp.]|nr:MAG: hypothetical protein EA388_02835 [Nitriliruptor sp.]
METNMTTGQDQATGALIERDGSRWYRIAGLEHMDPFLATVVSDSDLWMFVSSAGPLTAGRRDADHAILPYETDDRLHRAAGVSGPTTLVTRGSGAARERWQPFARRVDAGCTRALEKHELGTALTFEEVNAAWGLRIRMTWRPSRAYGWVRQVELTDLDGTGAEVEVVDGLLDLMPAGVDAETERRASNLVDAYKRSETGRWGSAAVYALESRITDRAEPAESLAATLVWSTGFDDCEVHLDERVLEDAWHGRPRPTTPLLTGRRGAYLLRGSVSVPPAGSTSWMMVADTGLGHAQLHDRIATALDPKADTFVAADAAVGAHRLAALLRAADGSQRTADEVADAHHLSNVLFNSMRGGIFVDGMRLDTGDLLAFLRARNRAVHERARLVLGPLGAQADRADVLRAAETAGDPDLLRLTLEYLPLTFSRRHGDPSRPWNRFSIRVTAEDGGDLLHHEGNWRDIFQNWEALLRSYPRYLSGVVATFVNASTADGHNPYRISRDGIDWEVPDPDDPWSNIGYWGDHQIVYLLRLLEAWEDTEPGGVRGWLDRAVFTYADVPYRIAGHAQMLTDPRSTIAYDRPRAAAVADRVEALGGDGRLLVADGDIVRVTLAEKLLVPALAKLSAYVAGGGIWMNTQRPEWNDANNALAGYGLSMVTLYQLERYLRFLADVLTEGRDDPLTLSTPVARWLDSVLGALLDHEPEAAVGDPSTRRALLDALGAAGTAHREGLEAGFETTPTEVELERIDHLIAVARDHLRATIRAARRPDGLYHTYNLVSFPNGGEATVEHLPLMLEGQVAVLGTDKLDAAEVADVVDAMFDAPLYRRDQRSFMLYPVPDRPGFLDRNTIPAELVAMYPLLDKLASGSGSVVQRDAEGGLHFAPELPNAEVLASALEDTGLADEDRAAVQEVYEQLFHHHAFPGRSGAMHGYEGIGSIYWHMVAKLLLAVQERVIEVEHDGDQAVVDRLTAAYRRIRDGLGFRKDPVTYGAFPTDCYSHTPAHAGAQQPGMTGQVKEEVLTRAGELGVRVRAGRLSLAPPLLPAAELWTDLDDGVRGYAFNVCAVPVRVVQADEDVVEVSTRDGSVRRRAGRALTTEETGAVLDRDGSITSIEFRVTSGAARRRAEGGASRRTR